MNQSDIEEFLIKNVRCSSISYKTDYLTIELSLSDEPLLKVVTKKSDIKGLCHPIDIYLIDEKSALGNILLEFISSTYITGYCFNCLIQTDRDF